MSTESVYQILKAIDVSYENQNFNLKNTFNLDKLEISEQRLNLILKNLLNDGYIQGFKFIEFDQGGGIIAGVPELTSKGMNYLETKSTMQKIQVEFTNLEEIKQTPSNITYNFHGDNARINNNSTDNSTNIVYNNPEVIKQLNALRDEVNKLENNSKESLEIIETIEEQLKSKQPNKTIVKSLIGALPQIANIVSIGATILSFL